MATQFRNLVFEGGGVRGVAYAGAMRVLEQRGVLEHIRRVGGTSAGAINSLAFALGYTVEEQRDILFNTDFKRFMDDTAGFIRDLYRLCTGYGWYKGDYFHRWVGGLIKDKLGRPDATFGELSATRHPDLYVVGANLNTGFAEVFSRERHPDMPLAHAVRISMSIPIVFAAVRHNDDIYVDGGTVMNYPVKLFDRARYIYGDEGSAARNTAYYEGENQVFLRDNPDGSRYLYNKQTLGLRLDKKEEVALFRHSEPAKRSPINSAFGYSRRLVGAMMQVQENVHLHSDDWHRTVHIDTLKVGTMDFDVSAAGKEELIHSGVNCAEKYFQWFEDPNESPANRMEA